MDAVILGLVLAQGLPPEAVLTAAGEARREGLAAAAARRRAERYARLYGKGRQQRGAVRWPDERAVAQVARALECAGGDVALRGEETYPDRMHEALGSKAPPWLWQRGPRLASGAVICAVVGSRRTPPALLDGARRLGRALAEAGIPCVSGLAAGADEAALNGALAGEGRALALPAQGLLNTPPWPGLSLWSATLPYAPFHARHAVARNDMIAAMGDALVLVASELRGGSSYAVRWALAHGRPVWCFEAGRATPPANRVLLSQRRARALPLGGAAGRWVEMIVASVEETRRQPAPVQPDWVAALAG